MKVSKGGSGNWGTMPMPANDPTGKKQDDIKALVKFIAGLAK
jgi:cytochrome c